MSLFSSFKVASRLPFELVVGELRNIDRDIARQVDAFDPELHEYFKPVCDAPGKRLRPALALLAGGACGKILPDHAKLGVVLELIHMATLVHDDIIDGADTRRGRPTPNAQWGNGTAVLLGDSMLAHAMILATEFDSLEICREIGRCAQAVCQGEILQGKYRYRFDMSRDDYFRIIGMKTGALFAAAAEIAAMVSKSDPLWRKALQDYGMLLGTAYQVYDDCLDISGQDEDAGKTLGTDLDRGKLTLPMLIFLESASPEDRQAFEAAMREGNDFSHTRYGARETQHQLLLASCETARQMARQASAALDILPESRHRKALASVGEYMVELIDRCAANF